MGMMRAILLGAVLSAPLSALAEPSYHRVTGVASDDSLNIRSAPGADSADIGDLAHDARGIEVLGFDDSGDWARIGLAEGDGWISARFLTRDPVATLGDTSVPTGLSCAGTEPFWALQFDEGMARFSDPEGGDLSFPITEALVAEGRLGSPALIGLGDAGLAIVTGHMCSDGMSDRSYGWALHLRIGSDENRRFVSGCCHLPRG